MRAILKQFIAILYLLLFKVSEISSQNTPPQGYFSDNYWIEHFDKINGLPESNVSSIIQDFDGTIWITTRCCLVHYDGCDFISYNPADQFPGEYFIFYEGLKIDPYGTIWCVSQSVGILSFDIKTKLFSKYDIMENDGDINFFSTTLEMSDNGDIWINSPKGITQIKNINGKYKIKEYKTSNNKYIDSIFHELNNLTPIIQIDKVKDFADIKKKVIIDKPTDLIILSMGEAGTNGLAADYGELIDQSGNIVWTMQEKKWFHAGGDQKNIMAFEELHLQPGKYALQYISDDSHSYSLWNSQAPSFPAYWGIHLFPANKSLLSVIHNFSNKIDQDLAKVLKLIPLKNNRFLGITYQGLVKIKFPTTSESKLSIMPMEIRNDFIPGLAYNYLDSNTLFIPGNIIDAKTGKQKASAVVYTIFNEQLNIVDLDTIDISNKTFLKDRLGNYWLAGLVLGGGLYVSDEGTEYPIYKKIEIKTPEGRISSQTSEWIFGLFEDKDGGIWVGSNPSGLFHITPKKYSNQIVLFPNTNNSPYSDIIEDAQGNILLAGTKILSFYNSQDNATLSFANPDSIDGDPNLFMDNGIVSYGSHTGIKRWDEKVNKFTTEKYSTKNSLIVKNKDSESSYWYQNLKQDSLFIYHNDVLIAIQNDSLNLATSPYLLRSKNGDIWFFIRNPPFGVCQYRIKNNRMEFIKRYLFNNKWVTNLIDGNDNIIWVGIHEAGLIQINANTGSYRTFTTKDGLPSNTILKVQLLKDKLWVVTDISSGFFHFKDSVFKPATRLDELLNPLINNQNALSEYSWQSKSILLKSGKIACIVKNGFVVFDPNEFDRDSLVPSLIIKNLFVNQAPIRIDQNKNGFNNSIPTLHHHQNDLVIEYQGVNYDRNSENTYSYFLKGANKEWVSSGKDKAARYSNLSPGKYEFYLKSANADGIWSDEKLMLKFTIAPPWWKTWWSYALYIITGIFTLRYYLDYKSKTLIKQNLQLETVVNTRTHELNKSLDNLKSTQAQLIQSEKMASLGELTAGIAHEIQNPLNFVNNFSEVSNELIDEMNAELNKGDIEEAKAISSDLKQNLEKINQHGLRASSIVKGMLEHSRKSSGEKTRTDINALCDEYLRLAYHGYRAKNKSFNADFELIADDNLPKINVIPQDMGRVLFNLINNAFWAVNDKKFKLGNTDYNPKVTVTTKALENFVEISIRDNGNGIPDTIKDKIYQPFFTTKPTGQGTGLGLSLAYDIINAHRGTLELESKENEGSVFKIRIPI